MTSAVAGASSLGLTITRLPAANALANGESVRRAAALSYAPRPYTRFGMTEVGKALQRWIAGPSAQQGLLIARAHYDELGGHRDPRRPEAALNRRIGRRSLVTLTTRAATI